MSVLHSPPMSQWNDLSNADRQKLLDAWEFHSCPHFSCGDAGGFYDAVRAVLIEREKRMLRATMSGERVVDFANAREASAGPRPIRQGSKLRPSSKGAN